MSNLRSLGRLTPYAAEVTRGARIFFYPARRYSSDEKTERPAEKDDEIDEIDRLLSKPSWSVRSLLPSNSETSKAKIGREQLHHLLRLSALPLPKSQKEEKQLLKTLRAQLHFVEEIQSVDTTGIEPLQAIRDETKQGIEEQTIGLKTLRRALAKEEIKGRSRRPRRKRDVVVEPDKPDDWDVLGNAERTVGKYFVVNTQPKAEESSAVDEKVRIRNH